MENSRFLITESILQTLRLAESGQTEAAYNFASLVVWRVDHHKSWLTDGEWIFINHCLGHPPRPKARRKSSS